MPATAATAHPTATPAPLAAARPVQLDPDVTGRLWALRRPSRDHLRDVDLLAPPAAPIPPSTAPAPPVTPPPPVTPAPRRPSPRPTAAHKATQAAQAPVALPIGTLSAVLGFALAQVGDAYVSGATGPNAWDCSGLVEAAYARVGITLPHNAAAMLSHGQAVSRSELRPGDLVFPSSEHVSIYVGNGEIVEAANSRVGVVRRPMWGFWTARRLL